MTNETSFKSQHYVKRPGTASGYPITAEYPIKYLIESFPVLKKQSTTIEAVSQCGGLVCCFDAKRGRQGQYYVCRPATRQCVTIYNPNLMYRTVATAIVTNIGGSAGYKIIRFSMPKNNNNDLACEIFYSRHATWYRFTNDIPQLLHFTRYVRSRQARPIFLNGSVNWLITDTVDNKMYIFAFDVENETWRLIQVPPKPTYIDVKWISKIALNVGKLCYVLMLKDGPEMIVWTLETHMTKQWWRNEKVNFMQANKFKEELDMELRHCSKSGSLNCFFTKLWKKFQKSKLSKFSEERFLPRECLASKYLADKNQTFV